MKINVCEEITSMNENDKSIALLQPTMSPGRFNLKLQANVITFLYFTKCGGHFPMPKNKFG